MPGTAFKQQDIVSFLVTSRTLSQDTGACYNSEDFSLDMVELVFASGLPTSNCTTCATCLGVEFDTLAMTKSVHPERLI